MTPNVGGIDRMIRVVAGLALIAAGIFGPLGWWVAIGLVPLATAGIGSCPLYTLLGLNTCPLDQRKA